MFTSRKIAALSIAAALLAATAASAAFHGSYRSWSGLGTNYVAGSDFAGAGIVTDGYPIVVSAGGVTNGLRWTYGDGAVRFYGCLTGLYIDSYQQNLAWQLYRDGVQVGQYTENGDAAAENHAVTTSLDGTCHQYTLLNATAASGAGAGILQSIQVGIGDSVSAPTPSSSKTIEAFYGDSITVGIGAYSPPSAPSNSPPYADARLTDSYQLAALLGRFELRAAASGACLGPCGNPVSSWGLNNTSAVTGNSGPEPARVWIRLGTNDISGEPLGTGCSDGTSTFAGSACAMLHSLRSGLSSTTPIMVEAVFPRSSGDYADQNTALASGVASYASTYRDSYVTFIPTAGWFDPTNSTYTLDGLHPTPAGYALIYNREIPIVETPSFTASGPSSGVHGSPSSNFTVTLSGGATFTGDQTVTISDGGAGGTITPSVGSPGTSSITVTPTANTSSFTFTYSAASSGAKTLTLTNGQAGWSNPLPLSYTAS